nr:hypothetical protein [Bacillus sp. HMF5848]
MKRDKNTDVLYEGRKENYVDVDRMINEGLAGGSVHVSNGKSNIEENIHLPKEEPPYEK